MTKKLKEIKNNAIRKITESHIWGSVLIYNSRCIFVKLICSLFFLCACDRENTSERSYISNDEIAQDYFSLPERRDSLRKLVDNIPSDTLRRDYYFKFSYHFYKENDSTEFRYWNNKTFTISREKGDTLHLAEAHWDLGNFLKNKEKIDSSFYHYQRASILFKLIGEEILSARMMLNMGIIQRNVKDYTGSEITTSNAISIIKPLKEHFQLYVGYNSLGITYNQLGEYKRALNYHEKAYERAIELKRSMLKANTLNNMGVVHFNSGNYLKSITYYEAALKIDSLPEKNIRLYAMLHDNIAYSKMKINWNSDLKKDFLFALRLRDSINHRAGIVINKIHLGEYFAKIGDSATAINYLVEANNLALEDHYYGDYLESLLLLAKVDKNNSKSYLSTYIKLDDSLQREERNIRNKFARIRFETDEFIAQNELLTQQRRWIMGGSAGLILIVGLLFVIRNQKINNKKLQLEQAQQKANEEIYNLLLEQENKIEEGRSREKERISRDLHDGVLSKIFGTRFVLGSLIEKTDEPSLAKKKNLLNELRLIEEEIRNISHDLGSGNFPEQAGFPVLVEKLLEEQKKITNFIPSVTADEQLKWEKIPNRIKINIYKILQEAVQNINKYAKATEVNVSFEKLHDKLKVTISDNGHGFVVERKSQGIGLKNMESRIGDLQGTIKITSGANGTKIITEIPIGYG